MKGLISLIVLVAILMVGCNDDSSILEPENDFTDSSPLNKGRLIPPKLDDDKDKDLDDFYLGDSISYGGNIKLVDDRNLDDFSEEDNYKVTYSQNFTINGAKGGKIAIKHQWKNDDGRVVWLKSELNIPKGAFKGTLTFDMIFDIDNLSMELYPSPFTFDKPVEFSMYWYGLDLTDYAKYDFDFNYLDGEEEKLENYYTNVDIVNGNLVVWGAKLNHFSRYGWTRTPPETK